jgi:hypothetical protein
MDQIRQTILDLYRAGQSARQIASYLGTLSRSAVLGHIKRARDAGINVSRTKPIDIVPANEPGTHLVDLEAHHCRWPLWEGKTPSLIYCGCSRQKGSAYCATHHARAYVGPSKIKKQKRVDTYA